MEMPKKRLRFGEFDEIILLREVLSLNPFENPREWDIIQEHVFLITQKKFMIRTLKDHLERLIKLWLEKTKILKSKSGIEEPHTEKDNLCQNIYELMECFRKEKRVRKSSATVEAMAKKQGESDRNKWASMMVDTQPVQSIQNSENIEFDHSYFQVTGPNNAEDFQEEIVVQFDMNAPEELVVDDTEDKENPSNSNTSRTSISTSIPVTPAKEATKASPCSLSSTAAAKFLAPVRSRQRKASVQRQGLAYLQKYDKDHMDLKEKEMKLEERKVALQEQKHTLEKEERTRQAAFEERKMELLEYETRKKVELEERRLNLEENKIKLEMEDKKMLKAIVERQDKIINIILTKNCSI